MQSEDVIPRQPVPRLPTQAQLQIDNVLASQPEAGPVVPEGGYGWLILIASFYVKNILVGLPIAYGLLLMFTTLETGISTTGVYYLWSNPIVSTPLLYVTVQLLSDPICHLIIRTSKWPRFVALVGICLVCASILMLWLSIVDGFARTTLCVSSGIFAGFGTNLVFIQIETSIAQYFRLKLSAVEAVLRIADYTGVIYTSLVMGRYLNLYGIGHSIIWYHLIVLTSGMVVLVFKKPNYLKRQQVYRIIRPGQTEEDDEEDIFSKNKVTELQSPHTSLPPVIEVDEPTATSTNHSKILRRSQWETFDENITNSKQQTTQNETSIPFEDEEEFDTDHNALPVPRELFTEGQINNNVTYSFEPNTDTQNGGDDMTNIFLPVPKSGISHSYLRTMSFYQNFVLQISITTGIFILFTLFPSHVYYSLQFLHKESVSHLITNIFLASLLEACFIGCWKFSKVNRAFPIALLLWLSAIGNFFISDGKKEILTVIGGVLITTSTCALQFLTKSIIINHGKTRMEYAASRILCAICFIIFFVINPSYENCFRLVGLLQFCAGSISFCTFVHQKISTIH